MTDTPGTQINSTATVCPPSDVVASSVTELRLEFRRLIAAGVQNLTLDFCRVAMLDSAGIGLLVATHNSLKNNGGHLTIVHASSDVLDLLRTMRLHRHFEISGE